MDSNSLNYKVLKIKSFFNKITPNDISISDLKLVLKDCYYNCAFSTLPYFTNGYNSSKSFSKTNTGNCVSLSLYIKKILKKKYKINSFLIPASIPIMYQKAGFLEISHVALAVPKNEDILYILDPAFYFMTPITIDFNSFNRTSDIDSVNIYESGENRVSFIHCQNKITDSHQIFNEYQTIPKNTVYCHCNLHKNVYDTWNYYLIEVLNPDQAISNFFLNSSEQFITTTRLTQDGYCKMYMYLKFYDGKTLSVKIDGQQIFSGDPKLMDRYTYKIIEGILKNYGYQNIKKYLSIKNIYFDF